MRKNTNQKILLHQMLHRPLPDITAVDKAAVTSGFSDKWTRQRKLKDFFLMSSSKVGMHKFTNIKLLL